MDVEAIRCSREEYVRKVLDAYRQIPGTTGNVRRQDRLLAAQLHDRAVPLNTVENALILAAARRLLRPAYATPLAPGYRALPSVLPTHHRRSARTQGQR
jgi:hypothetical protein